jgi:hypothetical protein
MTATLNFRESRVKSSTTAVVHAKHAKSYVKDTLGIPLPKRPKFLQDEGAPELPDDLSDLSAGALTNEMSKWTKLMSYTGSKLSLADIRHRQADDTATKSAAIEFMRMRNDNPEQTMTAIRAAVDTNSRILALREKAAMYEAEKKLLGAVYQGQDQSYKLLSRELTRRTSGVDRHLDP